MKEIRFKPIGIIHSPFFEPEGTPIQVPESNKARGVVEIFPEFAEGLKDIDGFSHIILIYHFHLLKKVSLTVTPYLDRHVHGVFATRAPVRPNHIGFSVVELTKLEGNRLYIKNVDIIDGTPLLDIKPYVPQFDYRNTTKTGWLENTVQKHPTTKDDGRFLK